VASSLLGPHQRQAPDATTHNLTPHNPHDHDPMNPPDPSRDEPPAGDFRGVASSIQGPHPRQLVFPPHPCPGQTGRAVARVYLKPSRASRFAVRGQQPSWQQQHHPVRVGREPPLCPFEPRTRRQRWRRKRRRR